jgi:hypothetical protein
MYGPKNLTVTGELEQALRSPGGAANEPNAAATAPGSNHND